MLPFDLGIPGAINIRYHDPGPDSGLEITVHLDVIDPAYPQKVAQAKGYCKLGTRCRTFWHLPYGGRPVKVTARWTRWRLPKSRRRPGEPAIISPKLPLSGSAERFSEPLREYIAIKALSGRAFSEVSKETGPSASAVQDIVLEAIKRLNAAYVPKAAPAIGIDEMHFAGKIYLTVHDLDTGALIEMDSDYSKTGLIALLRRMEGLGSVKTVVADFSPLVSGGVDAVFGATVTYTIDRFHVEKQLWECADAFWKHAHAQAKQDTQKILSDLKYIRKFFVQRESGLEGPERATLRNILDKLPGLKAFHKLKEDFCAILDMLDRAAAESAYRAWEASIPGDLRSWMQPLLDLFNTRWEDIFSYFDGRYTNGHAENNHKRIKSLELQWGKLPFRLLRARALASYGPWSRERIREAVAGVPVAFAPAPGPSLAPSCANVPRRKARPCSPSAAQPTLPFKLRSGSATPPQQLSLLPHFPPTTP